MKKNTPIPRLRETALRWFSLYTFTVITVAAGLLFLFYMMQNPEDATNQAQASASVSDSIYNMRYIIAVIITATVSLILLLYVMLYNLSDETEEKAERVEELEAHRKELMEARDAAESANKAKTLFINNMSHDIRTPMNAIIGFADLMEKKMDDQQVVSDYLAKIKSSGEYLLSIINDVLDMARIESGKTVFDEQFFDFNAPESNIIPMFEEIAHKKKIHFEYHEKIKHRYVWLDSTKQQQITMNLLSNAVKYTPEGGNISVSMIEKQASQKGYGRYILTVSDTGIGMSEEFLEHIYETFTRERNSTESKVLGTGLGMSIVKKLVDLVGGTIEIKSRLGEGSTFIVSIEHKIVVNPEEFLAKSHRASRGVKSPVGRRVLLAEDNELNAEIAITILEEMGLKVERAVDGVECVKMLNEAEAGYYDLILMDIQMPNLDGYDATKRIREFDNMSKADIPIIAMTANAFDEDKKKAMEAGMDGHLAKPINMNELKSVLNINLK